VPKPKHIPKLAWETAQQLMTTPHTFSGICAGGYISDLGLKITTNSYGCGWDGYVCHAYLARGLDKNPVLLFDYQTATKRREGDEEANLALHKWLLTESPVRKFILNDTVESLSEGGAIIDCTKAGPSVCMWLCKVLRAPMEENHRVPLWYKLVQGGVHPVLALCVAHCVDSKYHDQETATHCSVFEPPADKAGLKRLFIDHLPEWTGDLATQSSIHFQSGSVFGKPARGNSWAYRPCWPAGGKHLLPILKGGATEKIDDGWGGWTEKPIPTSVEQMIKDLVKLQKEYI
jgi:hypothetical protein